MNIISIDFSLYSTGVYVNEDGKERSFTIKNKPKTPRDEAFKNVFYSILKEFENKIFDFAIVEEMRFNFKNKNSVLLMGELSGIVKLACAIKSIPIVSIMTATWQSLTITQRDKKKNEKQYIEDVKSKYGLSLLNNDEADAFLMYRAVSALAKKTSHLSDAQKKIRKRILEIVNNK